ncbi:MAG: aminotransferase class I/II-fold pyridoxal phosphate-dependent enzyme [Eubacteriales bacterium]|nr:aminotransferase class I/II-fold pyridoxal phosphate-dependent enzyme [Eubacteriales bacterium]
MNDKVTIRPFDHGGAAREGQLDFSANISPLGVPGPVKTVLRDLAAGDGLARYPDPDCAALRAAIAGREEVLSEQVLCGNGAADLIYRFVTALHPKRALVLQPTFSEYGKALDLAGCDVDRVVLTPDDDFVWPDDLPDRLGPELDLFVFCSPNNPTGVSAPVDLLERVLDRCAEMHIHVLWDASFLDFSTTPDAYRAVMRRARDKKQDLYVLNSFTKLYALAGLRLGYLLAPDAGMPARMQAAGAPWTVSTAAQAAGAAALGCDDYVAELRRYIANEKEDLREALESLGVRVVPSDANFFLLRTEREDLADVLEKESDIVVRRAGNFPGLDDHWVRVAVRTRDDDQTLIRALKEVLVHG